MKTARKNPVQFSRNAAWILLAGISPFALYGIIGLCAGHGNCPAIIFYWLITITGLFAACQIKKLSRRYALTISEKFIIYKKPFASHLIKFADVLSIHAAPDNNLVLTTLSTTLVVPRSIFTSYDELAKAKKLLERFAPPSCRIDLRTIALGTI